MMRRSDPRIRQTINQISYNLESANESAQEGIYTFSQNYISPCFASIGNCVYTCAAPCLPSREDRLRRRRRGRAEANFDFYDDWDNDLSDDGFLGWGNDELDRLLAGSGLTRGISDQPRRQRAMSYGTRGPRRRSSVIIPDNRHDPTVIPSSSFLGFLERFRWRFGSRGLKYRPSAADLQENPGGLRHYTHEEEPLMEAADEAEGQVYDPKNGRDRSATQSSRETNNSLSSRGDLIPSDEEEDAVPLDDEFALVLDRRGGLDADDQQGKRSDLARRSTSGTLSSKTTTSSRTSGIKVKKTRQKSPQVYDAEIIHDADTPSMSDLKKEEDQAAFEEEMKIAKRRKAARSLALRRGLERDTGKSSPQSNSTKPPTPSSDSGHYEYLIEPPLESVEKREFSDGRHSVSHQSDVEQNTQTEPFPPLPVTPQVVDQLRAPSTSQSERQQNPSRSSASIDHPDHSLSDPGDQDSKEDDVD